MSSSKIRVGNVSMPLNSSLIRGRLKFCLGRKPIWKNNSLQVFFQGKIQTKEKAVVSQGGNFQ
jgi:hypothetical protein